MTCVRSKNISSKYQRFTTLGSKDIGIRKSVCGKESIPLHIILNDKIFRSVSIQSDSVTNFLESNFNFSKEIDFYRSKVG